MLESLTADELATFDTNYFAPIQASAVGREVLESSLDAFVRAAWHVVEPDRPLVWNWHLTTMCGYLEALARRQILRLIINVPPGAMKSLTASVFFPAWIWTQQPGHRFLCGANEDTLATRDSLKMRRLIESDWYQELWGGKVRLSKDQAEKTLYENTRGGFRQSQGIRGDVTGKRGDILIWDDPHDTRSADYEGKRVKALDAWDNAWSNRKNDPSTSAVLFIMQRSHDMDACGHVMAKEKQDWTLLAIPMHYDGPRFDAGKDIGRPDLDDPRTEHGELMFPERFPTDVVEAAEEDLGSYGTAAQHQQRPSPLGGGEVKPEWFITYKKKAEKPGFRFAIVDPAGERKPGRKGKKDNTAAGMFEARADGNIYLLDAVRDRLGLLERTDLLFEWHRKYRPAVTAYEEYGKDSDIVHIKDVMEREAYRFRIIGVGGALRKEDRIRRVFPRLERGGIYFPEFMTKTLVSGKVVDLMQEVLNDEVKSFPLAKFDDFLDMLCRIEDLEEAHLIKWPIIDEKPMVTFAAVSSWESV